MLHTGGATRMGRTAWYLLGVATLCAAVVAFAGGGAATADPVKVDKPVRVATLKADKTRVAGRVSSYDVDGFELLDDKNNAQTVKWSDLPARSVMEVYGAVLAKGTAADWVAAGQVMYHLSDGKDFGERAFARALRLDPKVKDKVEDAKKAPAAAAAGTAVAGAAPGTAKPGTELIGAAGKTGTAEDFYKHWWGKLTDEEQAESVKELKAFAEGTRKGKDGSLKLLETKYFLFYSDLKPAEAQNWSGLLDKMYARLSEIFAVPKETNLWRGKGLIFVFSKAEDYRKFEAESHQTDAGSTLGMCHSYSTGYDHIAFFRQSDDLEFAHVLVHESVHGFVHRYKSHVNIPSWANEGLAEVIAYELVPQKGKQNEYKGMAVDYMRQRGVGDDFFDATHIAAWQYPVAQYMTSFMISANKKGYVAFINGVKDGQTIDDSLAKNYGAPRERVTAAYLESMGIKQQKGGK